MRARAPDYCATGITANQNMTRNAQPARLPVWFDDCLHQQNWSGCRLWCQNPLGWKERRSWGSCLNPHAKSAGRATAECRSHAVRASQVTSWERPACWLIRSRAPSIVLFSGRADHWFPALCYCSCRREAAAGIARLLRVLSAEQWAAAPTTNTTPHPNPPPPRLSCVWSRSVCSPRQVQVNKCTERMWSLICINL